MNDFQGLELKFCRNFDEQIKMKAFRFILMGFWVTTFCLAEDVKRGPSISADNQEAIKKTQELLKDPANLQKSAEASKLFELMGNEAGSKQDLSNTTASIFEDLAAKTGGDPEKLRKLLEEAKSNPEAFANQLSAEQKAAISGLAKKIEENNGKKINLPQSQKQIQNKTKAFEENQA